MARINLPSYFIGNGDDSPENQAAIDENNLFDSRCREEAKKLTDDPMLQEVYAAALWFECDDCWTLPTPTVKDGIKFYRVGRNASHDFYMGVKDGMRYRGSFGEDYIGPKDGCDCMDRAMKAFAKWEAKAEDFDNWYDCEEACKIERDCKLNHYDYVFSYAEVPDGKWGYLGHC